MARSFLARTFLAHPHLDPIPTPALPLKGRERSGWRGVAMARLLLALLE